MLLRSWAMVEPSMMEYRPAKLKAVLDLSLALFHWQRLVEALQADLKDGPRSGEPTGSPTATEKMLVPSLSVTWFSILNCSHS